MPTPPVAGSKTFPSLQNKTPHPLSSFSLFPNFPSPLATTNLPTSVSVDLSILDISYKWD